MQRRDLFVAIIAIASMSAATGALAQELRRPRTEEREELGERREHCARLEREEEGLERQLREEAREGDRPEFREARERLARVKVEQRRQCVRG